MLVEPCVVLVVSFDPPLTTPTRLERLPAMREAMRRQLCGPITVKAIFMLQISSNSRDKPHAASVSGP
ncbi:Hypothetical protein NocV09_01800540 [Nannochloropsis oceanica]